MIPCSFPQPSSLVSTEEAVDRKVGAKELFLGQFMLEGTQGSFIHFRPEYHALNPIVNDWIQCRNSCVAPFLHQSILAIGPPTNGFQETATIHKHPNHTMWSTNPCFWPPPTSWTTGHIRN